MTLWRHALVLVSQPGRPRTIRGFQGGVTPDHKVMHSSSLLSAVSKEDNETRAELLATCASYYVKVSVECRDFSVAAVDMK